MMNRSDFECPQCGAEVSPNAAGCRECEGRWETSEIYDGLDLPDDEFDYNEFVENEFGGGRKTGKELFWWIVALITLLAFIFLVFPMR